jgi:predicted secreted protein
MALSFFTTCCASTKVLALLVQKYKTCVSAMPLSFFHYLLYSYQYQNTCFTSTKYVRVGDGMESPAGVLQGAKKKNLLQQCLLYYY